MKRWRKDCALVLAVALLAGPLLLQEAQAKTMGGPVPCLATCCVGPRIGLEMNEGQPVTVMELLPLVPYVGGVFRLYLSYDYGFKAGGAKGFLASCCIGPRVGKEIGERKIRTKEKLLLIPVFNIIPATMIAMDAYCGKTMTEVEQEENLRR